MKLIVLDYLCGQVDIIKNIPDNIILTDRFISENLGYDTDSVSWILIEDDALITRYTYDPVEQRALYDNDNLLNG